MLKVSSSRLPRRGVVAVGGVLALVTASVLAAGVASASASQSVYCPAGQYCAWEDDLQQGNIFNNVVTMQNVGEAWNDRFSSLENRRGARVVFYEDEFGGGDQRSVNPGEVARQLQFEWTQHANTWNDRITSITAF